MSAKLSIETRKLLINQKCFTREDLLKLYEAISGSENGETIIIVKFNDGTEHSSNCVDFLDSGGILDLKKPNEVQITNHNKNNQINLVLKEIYESKDDENIVVVSGNPEWVPINFENLETLINSVSPLENTFKKYEYLFWGLIFAILLTPFVITGNLDLASNSGSTGISFISFGIGIVIGITTSTIGSILKKFWPEIELDVGPDHHNKNKLNRNKLAKLLTFVILPVGILAFGLILEYLLNI